MQAELQHLLVEPFLCSRINLFPSSSRLPGALLLESYGPVSSGPLTSMRACLL